MAYDSNDNMLEISLPPQPAPTSTIRPTSLYDYDAYNNVIDYCDPANNPNNGWQPSPSPSPCANSGATNYAKYTFSSDPQQTPDPNEPYGCLTYAYSPSGYKTSISYGGSGSHLCSNGLPTQTEGTQINQKDGTNRTPTQTFGYGPAGNLTSYNAGNSAWALSYTGDGMNQLRSREDPDGVTSRWCYNLDGSVFYSETAHQYQLDGTPSKCPTNAQLAAGTATPPPYAVSYGYDADGDVATETHHHNCTASACSANASLTSWCTPSVAIAAGTTCKYYDGLDRLVEVKQPYDTVNDVYINPWMTRYLYDLTGAQINWQGQSFYAYGNLFKTQEMLPTNPTVTVTTLTAGSITNPSYTAIRASAFDALDRAITMYSFVNVNGTEDLNTDTVTWDSSPIAGSNVVGFVGEDCNDLSAEQCQEFDYFPDGQEKTFESNDGSSPKRTYQYDPDGRVASITSTAYNTAQQYAYGVDGSLVTATDPSDASLSSPATLTHTYYADGSEERLDVSAAALSQTGLFTYSYRNDGRLSTYTIDDTSLGSSIKNPGKTSISYAYTSAGRLTNRSESGAAANTTPTMIGYDLPNSGFETSESIPSGTSLSQFSYSAESELLTIQASAGGTCGSATYVYSLRGELVNWPDCTSYYGAHAFMANGASLQPGTPPRQQYTWDNLMAVTLVNAAWCNPNCNTWSWNYDAAGRMNLESGPIGSIGIPTRRCYDAENHVTATLVISGACGSQTTGAVSNWGPNGHPITVGTYDGSGNLHNETLHWNGDQVLFATQKVNSSATLDDVKVDVQGDILPSDSGYNGLTFYDRAPGSMVMGCHNAGGANFAGLADSWGHMFHSGTAWSTPCKLNAATAMPTSIQWFGTYYTGVAGGTPSMGQGGSLGMPRTDGLTDGYDTMQGLRSYDSNAGTWTSADAFAGVLNSPASQKSYLWNSNDPVDFADPDGTDDLYLGFSSASSGSGPGYHAFAVLENDNGDIIQVYSFGPKLGISWRGPDLYLNNQYSPVHFANTVLKGNPLYWVKGCTRPICPWERTLNALYYERWPNNTIPYGLVFLNSNWALSVLLAAAGIPTNLPAGHPWLPGFTTCASVGSPNSGCSFFPSSTIWGSLGISEGLIYSTYGGINPWTLYCNDCNNHFPGLRF